MAETINHNSSTKTDIGGQTVWYYYDKGVFFIFRGEGGGVSQILAVVKFLRICSESCIRQLALKMGSRIWLQQFMMIRGQDKPMKRA